MKRQSNASGDAYEPSLPDLNEAGYIVSLVNEAGTVSSSGMGISGLTWQEIESWLNVTGLSISTWEKLMVFKMSAAYASEYSSATAVDAPEPFAKIIDEGELDREVVANRIRNILHSLKK